MAISLRSMANDTADKSVKKDDMFSVDPRRLTEEEGFNKRDYDDPDVIAHIEGFAKSYAEGKYVPPLLVRVMDDGQIVPVEGHCRRRGAMLAIERGVDLQFIKCIPFKGNDKERYATQLRSAEGLPLKPLGIAANYLQMSRLGLTNAEIAAETRKTGSHVEQMLLLATANHDIHVLVREGKVSASTAIDAVRAHGEGAGAVLSGLSAEAQAIGKSVVTRSALKPWAPPPKVMRTVVGSVEAMFASLDKSTRRQIAELEKADPETIRGKQIAVDAAAFLALVQAQHGVEQAKASRAEKDAAAAEKAAQQQMDV